MSSTSYLRTNTCGELSLKDVGKEVTLSGWVHRQRDHGGLIFIDLRDRFGLTQLVFDPKKDPKLHALASPLRAEWVVSIRGEVRQRDKAMVNLKINTGEIEVLVLSLTVLSPAKTPPFSICDDQIKVNEELRLRYRYLDMRRGELLTNLVSRHKITQTVRRYLDSQGFTEVQTPILGKATPEGARDYLVPSRVSPGTFYALPQSPQLFKQLLMVGGLDRYYQIAPCFRDEDLRAERQPEFTQIDIEMSFGTPKQLFPLVEGLVSQIFPGIKTPFRSLTYQECLEKYGTDKPDLRFDMPLSRLDDLANRSTFAVFREALSLGGMVKGICVKGGASLSRKEIEDYTSFVGRFGARGLAWMKVQEHVLTSNIVKFFDEALQEDLMVRMGAEEGDLLFFIADQPSVCNQALDHLRRKIARDKGLIDEGCYELLWVVDFPLFQWNAEKKELESEHHPFTMPLEEDVPLLEKDPLKARSSSYDLVINGYEIASGSQRIHDPAVQEQMFALLGIPKEEVHDRFGFFVEALQYGTPPHLGLALGLDRIMMLLQKTDHIRDVIAFPKTQRASDLMMGAPSQVKPEQWQELELLSAKNLVSRV